MMLYAPCLGKVHPIQQFDIFVLTLWISTKPAKCRRPASPFSVIVPRVIMGLYDAFPLAAERQLNPIEQLLNVAVNG